VGNVKPARPIPARAGKSRVVKPSTNAKTKEPATAGPDYSCSLSVGSLARHRLRQHAHTSFALSESNRTRRGCRNKQQHSCLRRRPVQGSPSDDFSCQAPNIDYQRISLGSLSRKTCCANAASTNSKILVLSVWCKIINCVTELVV
jgi:hypothetical protein